MDACVRHPKGEDHAILTDNLLVFFEHFINLKAFKLTCDNVFWGARENTVYSMAIIDQDKMNSARSLLGEEMFKQAVQQAFQTVNTELSTLRARRKAPDAEILHKTKGAALLLGFDGLAVALGDAELESRKGNHVSASNLLDQLKLTKQAFQKSL